MVAMIGIYKTEKLRFADNFGMVVGKLSFLVKSKIKKRIIERKSVIKKIVYE